MIKSLRTIACGLALAVSSGGLASAASGLAPAPASTPKIMADTGEKRLQRRPHRQRHTYRDRRSSHRAHHDRRSSRHDYRDTRRHASRCWSENQRSRYRGRPALISVRVCRDRSGRVYTVRGSARLVQYLRGYRRHW